MTQVAPRAIRLLIVDNSPTAREKLRRLFEDVPDIGVVGEAGTVERALRLIEETSPTAILMDCELPKPGSFAGVHEMMSLYPLPIIMMTKQPPSSDSDLESQVLETGAVALISWTPGGTGSARTVDHALIRKVRAMAEVKVVRRRGQLSRAVSVTLEPASASASPSVPSTTARDIATEIARIRPASFIADTHAPAPEVPAARRTGSAVESSERTPGSRVEIVAIGASTGGPPVLQTILRGFSRPLPVPIVLVQHLSRGFQTSLVSWLADSTHLRIIVGEHGMSLEPGVVYLAPDDRHMTLDASGRVVLNSEPPENASRPSVSVLFRSVAQRYGPHAVGVLLTGMGRDGAKELRLMRDKGAVTIAQDEETSVVHGMPGEAIKLKGARYVLPPDRIASVIEHHVVGSLNGVGAAQCR